MAISTIFVLLILAKVASSASEHSENFVECLIEKFRASNLGSDTIYTSQNATEYASLLQAYNPRPASISPRKPDAIVTPFHASEIRAAIQCCRKVGLHMRVKSGGHDYEGLSYTSASTPFVMVDMRNFRSVRVDRKAKTAWVQVGATLGQLYYTIARKSKTLAFTGGVCPTVGVGGHFSGGGYGMMSRKHSIAADQIVDAKLINADGEVVDRRSMGEDLFWAIRGGGAASFGIVLEYKVMLVSIPETVTVFRVERALEANTMELIHRWQHISDKVDVNLVIRIFLDKKVATFAALYLGRARALMPIMAEHFPELRLTEPDCTEMSWLESVLFFADFPNGTSPDALLDQSRPLGAFLKAKSDFVGYPIPLPALEEIRRFLLEDRTVHWTVLFAPYGGVMDAIPESETPFPHRRGNIFMIHYSVMWFGVDQSAAQIDWIRRLYALMARHVTRNPRAAYFNYKDLDIGSNGEGFNASYEIARVWGLSYYKSNFRRLAQVKAKVDPSNFFRNEQSIPPLLAD